MFRTLILFLLFYFIYRIFKKIFSQPTESNTRYKHKTEKIEGEKILPCENCQIYFPESQAIKHNGKFFCSKKCAKEFLEKSKK